MTAGNHRVDTRSVFMRRRQAEYHRTVADVIAPPPQRIFTAACRLNVSIQRRLSRLSPARVMGPLVCHEHGTSWSSGHGPC